MERPEIERILRAFLERAMPLLVGELRAQPLPSAERSRQAGAGGQISMTRLAGDGSTRWIYRAGSMDITAVAIANPLQPGPHPDENESFLAVRDYLHRRGIRVPDFYAADLDQGILLLEDLGDLRLYDVARAPWSGPEPRAPDVNPQLQGPAANPQRLYEQAIDLLVKMQAPGDPAFQPESVGNSDYNEAFILNEEARYFHKEMVCGLASLEHPFTRIEPDCRRLAREAVSSCPGPGAARGDRVFMHRDYQSRNLMVTGRPVGMGASGKEPTIAVIDFQGARLGPPEYDLASLIMDPYVALSAPLRRELLDRYLREASTRGVPGVPAAVGRGREWDLWHGRFLASAANRLMQALGAFAKLGRRLDRPGFLEHVPSGLSRLDEILQTRGDCPELLGLVRRLRTMDLPEGEGPHSPRSPVCN